MDKQPFKKSATALMSAIFIEGIGVNQSLVFIPQRPELPEVPERSRGQPRAVEGLLQHPTAVIPPNFLKASGPDTPPDSHKAGANTL